MLSDHLKPCDSIGTGEGVANTEGKEEEQKGEEEEVEKEREGRWKNRRKKEDEKRGREREGEKWKEGKVGGGGKEGEGKEEEKTEEEVDAMETGKKRGMAQQGDAEVSVVWRKEGLRKVSNGHAILLNEGLGETKETEGEGQRTFTNPVYSSCDVT